MTNEEEIRKTVADSINRGIPVEYGSEEDGVIIGYQNNAKEWICLHPFDKRGDGGMKPFVEKTLPWSIYIYRKRKEIPASRKDLAIEAMKQAVDMAKTKEAGNCYVGFNAWRKYIEKIKALDQADDDTRRQSLFGNQWIYDCIIQFRRIAVQYLNDIADEFDPEVSEHLLKAADLYEQLIKEILRGDEKSFYDIAPIKLTRDNQREWASRLRQEEVKRLEAALPLEQQAIQEIENALSGKQKGANDETKIA